MSGRLANKDFDQLEKWIGTGSKTFTLLFAITRDGCDAKVFHQKCDDIGPTVTVMYNANGSVYGGYNPTAWTPGSGNGLYNHCTDAFLFQLYLNGNPKQNKFVLKKGCYQNAVYNQPVYGPTFGGGHDLPSFTGTVSRSGDIFKLNMKPNFGNTYDMEGFSINEINNGNLIVTELEVYKVTYDERRVREPWRDIDDWNIQELEKLKEKVVTFKPLPDLNFSEAKIAMTGPVGAGKSSFYNTIDTIFRGRITQRACSGSAERSTTTGYIPYSVTAQSGDTLKFVLFDTPGLEDSTGLDEKECSRLLDGNIPNFYQVKAFDRCEWNWIDLCLQKFTFGQNCRNWIKMLLKGSNFNQDVKLPTKGSEKETATKDRIHCVLFVLDATTLDVLSS
ncbi:interferon-induced protein 44-like isoform X5 [Mercenaria mercenaria]|uniref:interferon-induced protein 44-like isoform X5 n=1 Tax=Mercenaria mercenaria TaxID=6596 RepID=UPI00234EFF73|nr:interferon-induced protein 44-like isoform X5 [Mercenaria mercenaria]